MDDRPTESHSVTRLSDRSVHHVLADLFPPRRCSVNNSYNVSPTFRITSVQSVGKKKNFVPFFYMHSKFQTFVAARTFSLCNDKCRYDANINLKTSNIAGGSPESARKRVSSHLARENFKSWLAFTSA